MIDRREIIDTASAQSLSPQVVEKDYVLGWILAGIYQHEALAESWIFKGGTCLKKCFFETYRFSEDLDFTLRDPSHLDAAFLSAAFADIADWIYERTGIELPAERQEFDVYANPRGNPSCQGKIPYRGPIAPRGRNIPNIKLDLTADEHLALAPVRVPIYHPYSDEPDDGIQVSAYAYEEAFGEKVRALAERARPRDLYDVVNLYRNTDARPSPSVLLDVLRQKCEFKGIPTPRAPADLQPHRADLEGAWDHMLGHQLPALPPVQTFWDALPEFFAWLETGIEPEIPAAYQITAGETVLRERTLRLPVSGIARSYLEVIRFAAANRLCVDLLYKNETRRIEPYSLRRTQDENIILHAYDTEKEGHRSYRVDRIQGARSTGQTFVPRYAVELSPAGPVIVQPTAGRAAGVSSPSRAPRMARRRNEPHHVYECPYCRRRFYRKRYNSVLKPHNDKNGYRCSGRHATYIGFR